MITNLGDYLEYTHRQCRAYYIHILLWTKSIGLWKYVLYDQGCCKQALMKSKHINVILFKKKFTFITEILLEVMDDGLFQIKILIPSRNNMHKQAVIKPEKMHRKNWSKYFKIAIYYHYHSNRGCLVSSEVNVCLSVRRLKFKCKKMMLFQNLKWKINTILIKKTFTNIEIFHFNGEFKALNIIKIVYLNYFFFHLQNDINSKWSSIYVINLNNFRAKI